VKKEFEEQLQSVLRRAARLRAAIEGSADITYVQVAKTHVRAHDRRAHRRAVITLRKNVRPALKVLSGGKR